MNRKTIITAILLPLMVFLGWRFIRPMNIFVVDERFAWPVDTENPPSLLTDLSAKNCGRCHQAFYREWQTTIHAQAWTDPYFQADWRFDGKQHNCRLCHTPLDRQQPQTVLAYRDAEKWKPVLEDNPGFDSALQHEGVTCAACHYREGKILGVLDTTDAPHPVQKIDNPNRICARCHIVEGQRWDTFFRFPPCGTVAEIRESRNRSGSKAVTSPAGEAATGEAAMDDYSDLGCVECHMPVVKRALVAEGEIRQTRHHYWRGGHDPAMVKQALSIDFAEYPANAGSATGPDNSSKRVFRLMITNVGAAHYVPTGTPDRHLTVHIRLRDKAGRVLDEEQHWIKRTLMWRPFIIDLWDSRLPRWLPRHYEYSVDGHSPAVSIEAEVRYHLLDENRRERIDYNNTTPVDYEIFRRRIMLTPEQHEAAELAAEQAAI